MVNVPTFKNTRGNSIQNFRDARSRYITGGNRPTNFPSNNNRPLRLPSRAQTTYTGRLGLGQVHPLGILLNAALKSAAGQMLAPGIPTLKRDPQYDYKDASGNYVWDPAFGHTSADGVPLYPDDLTTSSGLKVVMPAPMPLWQHVWDQVTAYPPFADYTHILDVPPNTLPYIYSPNPAPLPALPLWQYPPFRHSPSARPRARARARYRNPYFRPREEETPLPRRASSGASNIGNPNASISINSAKGHRPTISRGSSTKPPKNGKEKKIRNGALFAILSHALDVTSETAEVLEILMDWAGVERVEDLFEVDWDSFSAIEYMDLGRQLFLNQVEDKVLGPILGNVGKKISGSGIVGGIAI